jgi:hypothetical protein
MTEAPDPFEQFGDGLIAAQMIAFAAFHTVREILVDVAKMQPDAESYMTGLYDRVIAHLEPELGRHEKFAAGQARDLVGAIFRDALSAVRSAPPEGPETDAPRPPL